MSRSHRHARALLAVAAVLASLVGSTTAASASSSITTECAEHGFPGATGAYKLEAPSWSEERTGAADGFAVAVTELAFDGTEASSVGWSPLGGTQTVLGVLVKAGSARSTDGDDVAVYAGTPGDLTAATGKGISHITFCLGGGLTPPREPVVVADPPAVAVEGSGTYSQTYPWTVAKTAAAPWTVRSGDTAPSTYTITATRGAPTTYDEVELTGAVAVENGNAVPLAISAVTLDAPCTLDGDGSGAVAAGATATLGFTCSYGDGLATLPALPSATVAWSGGTASGGTAGSSSSAFAGWTPTYVDAETDVYDALDGGAATLVGTASQAGATTFTVQASLATPPAGCRSVVNVGSLEVGGEATATVNACRQSITAGGFTMGYWNNKNGKARVTPTVCAAAKALAPTWLGTFSCADLAGSLTTFNKAASSKVAASMLQAQLLATALNVATDVSPDGRAPLGWVGVADPVTGGCRTVAELLATADALLPTGDRATLLAYKDAFDRINNDTQPVCA